MEQKRFGARMRVTWWLLACAAGLGCAVPERHEHLVPVVVNLPTAQIQVLRVWQRVVTESPAAANRPLPICERVASAAAWRRFRATWPGGLAELSADWCDFEHDWVLALVTGRSAHEQRLAIDVSEEEGVDVLTVRQNLDLAASVPARATVLLLVVPRRAAQLAVVWQPDPAGGQAGGQVGESTLVVFPRL